MTTIKRQREIATWLLRGAQDMDDGLTRAKTAENSARPYLRGAFSVAPSRSEVSAVANLRLSELLNPQKPKGEK